MSKVQKTWLLYLLFVIIVPILSGVIPWLQDMGWIGGDQDALGMLLLSGYVVGIPAGLIWALIVTFRR